jgi:hypothetical protein
MKKLQLLDTSRNNLTLGSATCKQQNLRCNKYQSNRSKTLWQICYLCEENERYQPSRCCLLRKTNVMEYVRGSNTDKWHRCKNGTEYPHIHLRKKDLKTTFFLALRTMQNTRRKRDCCISAWDLCKNPSRSVDSIHRTWEQLWSCIGFSEMWMVS